MKHEIDQLKRYIYGRRSERDVPDSSQLTFFGDEPLVVIEADATESSDEHGKSGRGRGKRKRRGFPEYIPREVRTMDVPEAGQLCPCCGELMPIIDTDVRERLEYVPAKMVLYQLHYPKRACGQCKQTVTVALPPTAEEDGASLSSGSCYGFGVTAQIILGKYADHLPLYRLEDVFARAGVVIPRSTQVGLRDAAADVLRPLVAYLRRWY